MKAYILRLISRLVSAAQARQMHTDVQAALRLCQRVGKGLVYHIPFNLVNPQNVMIGDHIYFGSNVTIDGRGGLTIEAHVIFSDWVTVLTADHRYNLAESLPFDENYIHKPVFIGQAAWIGYGAQIVPGATIGEGAIIGMGAVVAGDIPAGGIAAGNPARVIKYREMERYKELKIQKKFLLALRDHKKTNQGS